MGLYFTCFYLCSYCQFVNTKSLTVVGGDFDDSLDRWFIICNDSIVREV